MKWVRQLLIIGIIMLSAGSLLAQTTYYSRDGGTSNWDLATSWTLSSDGIGAPAGPPGVNDYVIVLNGHSIEVNEVTDNGGTGQSADGLGLANVGAGGGGFTFPDSHKLNFFHNGEMTVEEGGTLTFSARVMFDGTIFIAGTLTTNKDIIILGNLYFAPTASFSSTDDLICSGNSNTRIDIPDVTNSWTSDDIYLDHTDAFVCGLGILNIGYFGGTTHIINLNNGAGYDQICDALTIVGCDNPLLCVGTGIFNPSQPTLSGAGGVINYVENDVLTIDNTIGVVYIEPLPYLSAATVTITGNYVDGEDVLALPGISSIVAVFDSGTGTLNLAGYGNISRWQTALRSVTYENLSDSPTTSTRTIEFQITDGFKFSNTIARDITIQPVNDPPGVSTISGSPTPLAYLEGVGDINIDDQITVDDPDDVNLEEASISLTNYLQGEDILDFTNAFGVSKAGFDPVTGILTLTGSATIANYQLALRAVTYENLSQTPDDVNDRTANFTVSDGDDTSPAFSRDIVITAINTMPSITGTAAALAYTEGDGAVLLDNALTPGDVDNVNLASATITISSNYESPEDVLAFTDQNGISGSYAAGVLTLTGSATIADYETALRSITYENTSNTPVTTTRTVALSVSDGALASTAITRDITIMAVNDLPTLTGTAAALAYTEGDGAVLLDNALTPGDVDNVNLASATITISSNYESPEDVLAFTDQNGISGSYAAGVLTLTGSATIADYETALRSITYENTSNTPVTTTRTVTLSVSDGALASTAITRDITIMAVNDLPTLTGTAAALAYTEGDGAVLLDNALTPGDVDNVNLASATITISSNYESPEDVLAFTDQNGISGSYAAGVLTLTGSATIADYETALRSITYENTSNTPVTTTRTVTLSVSDGALASTAITRDITIMAVNDLPTLTGTAAALAYTEGDGAVLLDNALTPGDVDNVNLASATITISSNYESPEDVLAFTDQNGISGSYAAGVLTLTGSATIADYETALRSITYENTSNTPVTTTRTVTLSVSDGALASTAITRDITIMAVNDLPTLTGTAAALAYTEGDGAVLLDNALTPGDVDNVNLASATITISSNYESPEDVLAFTDQNGISGSYAAGVLTLTGSATIADYETALRSITYENTSNTPVTTTRTVTLSVSDGALASTAITRDITIMAVNDLPTLTGTAAALAYTEGDGAVLLDNALTPGDVDNVNLALATITISSNYESPEDVLAFTDQNGISGSYAAGVLTLTGSATIADYETALRSITYENTSNTPVTTTRTVTLSVSDGALASTAITRDITIMAVNDLPTLTGTAAALAYTEGDGAVLLDNALTPGDVDNVNLALATITISSNYESPEDVLAFTDQNGISGSYAAGVLTLTGSATIADYETALRSITYENTSGAPSTDVRTVDFVVNDGEDNSNIFSRDIEITAIVEPPVITIGGGGSTLTIDYTEGDGQVPINEDLTITDPDDTNFESALITFTSNYLEGEDILAFTDQNGITGNFQASSGVLLLSGTATIAEYQTAMQSVTYENLSDNPSAAARTITEVVNDGDADSNPITITLNIIPVNDPPEISGSDSDLIYPESSGPLPIDNSISVTDADSPLLSSAEVSITGNYQDNEDVLSFTAQAGISGAFDASTGTLSLMGQASLSDYQAAIRSVSYENTNEPVNPATRTVEFIVNDGELSSNVFSVDILLEEVIDLVIVYQVVTPDGDSMNDSWVIDGIEQYPNNSVSVFNRWNNLVYQKSSYENSAQPWTGDANAGMDKGELPDGTYFYTVDLGDGSKIFEGFLVLKRR